MSHVKIAFVDDNEFEKLVNSSITSIPKEFLDKLENVTIVIEDLPTPYQITKLKKRGARALLLGLYEGVPQTRRGRYGVGGQLPDKITIFKKSILYIARSREDVSRIVQETVVHEIAHHFGMDEKMIRQAKSK